jgi:osmotically-inducible protein OsmY
MRNAALLAGAATVLFGATAARAQPDHDQIRFAAEPSAAVHAGHPVAAAADTAVLAKLNADARFTHRQIDVRSDDRNVITLSGEVSSEAEKALAGRIAADTQAVTEVRNLLVVRSK